MAAGAGTESEEASERHPQVLQQQPVLGAASEPQPAAALTLSAPVSAISKLITMAAACFTSAQ